MRFTRIRRRFATVAAAVAVTALGATSVSPATAQDAQDAWTQDYTDGMADLDTPTASDTLWQNPDSRSADPESGVTAQVTAQSAAEIPTDGTLDVTLRVHNGSELPVTGLELRAQYADPVTQADGVATSLLANQGEYPWIGQFVPLDGNVGTLSPGESRNITLSVPVGDDDAADTADTATAEGTADTDGTDVSLPGLGITDAGVRPVLFNLNGVLGDADTGQTSYLAGARTTLTVTDSDDDSGNGDNSENSDAEATDTDRTPGLTVLWPLSSAATALPGQVGDAPDPAELYLPDETLAGELGEDGRLRGLLDTWRDHVDADGGEKVRSASCLAVDPDLLETVDRMTDGYRVGSTAPDPVEEPTRLRDSWGRHDDGTDSVAGTGAQDATAWLDDLRTLVAEPGTCVVPLPYANADVNAVAAGGDPWLSEELSDRSVSVVEDVLGVTPADGVQIPGSGYVQADALPSLARDDLPVTAVVAASTVTAEDPEKPVATLPSEGGAGVRALRYPASLGAALAATGDRPETAAYSAVSSRRDLAADGAASRMAAAVGVLDRELDAAGTEGSGVPSEVLAVPPAAWSVDAADADTFLDAVTDRLTTGRADAVSFGDALAGEDTPGSVIDPSAADPAPVDDGEARNAAQVAGHLRNITNIMEDVPNIALTRRIYTRPLFDDLLRAVTDTGRRVQADAAAVRAAGTDRTNQVTGTAYTLRTAVSLLPPGNVFTRTSDSSPLIVVARNGLPLPVTVRVNWSGAPGVTLNTPGVQQIPAQGSVTLQMTSSIPEDAAQSDLTLFLSTPDDVRISEDVTIRLADVPGIDWRTVGVVIVVLAGLVLGGRAVRKRRHAADGSPRTVRVQDDGPRD